MQLPGQAALLWLVIKKHDISYYEITQDIILFKQKLLEFSLAGQDDTGSNF